MLSSIISSQILRTTQLLTTNIVYHASKMQASSTSNNKDSAGRRLGLKKFGGQEVMPGDIIARQRGFKWHSGQNVIAGKDQTIHSRIQGIVRFRDGKYRKVPYKIIDVIPVKLVNRTMKHPPPYLYHPELFPERQAKNHPQIVRCENNPKKVTYKGMNISERPSYLDIHHKNPQNQKQEKVL